MLTSKLRNQVRYCWNFQRQQQHQLSDGKRADDAEPDADAAPQRRRRGMHLPLRIRLVQQAELRRVAPYQPRGDERDEQAGKNRAGEEKEELARGHRREFFLSSVARTLRVQACPLTE